MHYSRIISALWILILPVDLSAQEVLDPPTIILSNVPFQLVLQGGAEGPAVYEVRSGDDLLLAEGTVSPQNVSVVTNLTIDSNEQLPLQVILNLFLLVY